MNKTMWLFWVKWNTFLHKIDNFFYDIRYKIKEWHRSTFHPTKQEIWEKMMVKTFPELYKNPAKRSPFQCDGFANPPGWNELIYNLSKEITDYVKERKRLGDRGIGEWFESDVKFPTVLQIKSKFGGLRYYIGGGDKQINNFIDTAEEISYKTCENCGSMEYVTTEGAWLTTLCKKCREKK